MSFISIDKNIFVCYIAFMFRIFKIVTFNFIAIILILLFFEFCFSFADFKKIITQNPHIKTSPNNYIDMYKDMHKAKPAYKFQRKRTLQGKKYLGKRPAIVLIGCSYTYGVMLEDDENFSGLLSKYAKRPVFNLGLCGASPRDILYYLRKNNYQSFGLQKDTQVEYFIYTNIFEHEQRLFTYVQPSSPDYYVNKKKEFIYFPLSMIEKTSIKKYFSLISYDYYFHKKSFNLLKLYVLAMNNEIQKNFSNNGKKTKFVVLVYSDEREKEWKDFEKDYNIKILFVKDLVGKSLKNEEPYLCKDGEHPNKSAWELIIPPLMKELNL